MIVFITGISSGFGLETAKRLSQEGHAVYGTVRREVEPLPNVHYLHLDVRDREAVKKAVDDIVEKEGRIDVLVNNAGMGIGGPLEFATEEEVRLQMDTNFMGLVHCVDAVLPYMRQQGGGKIIALSSIGGLMGLPFQGFYSAAKAALLSVSESLSMELKGTGIECCSVLPGDVATGFTAARTFTAAAQDPGSPYRVRMDRNLRKIEKDELGGMQPEVIGRAILRQLRRRHMCVRVIPRIDYGAVGFLVRILPEKAKLALLDLLYS